MAEKQNPNATKAAAPAAPHAAAGVGCTRCGKTIPDLKKVDGPSKKKLIQKGHQQLSEGHYCKSCMAFVMNEAYSTVLERRVRIEFDKRKTDLWESRIRHLKDAKNSKNPAQTIQHYLSYLKIIELVLEIEAGALEPGHFRTIKGEKEKNIVSSVYFEMMKLYDKSGSSSGKLAEVLQKMELFLPDCRDGKNLAKLISKYVKLKECRNKKEINVLIRKLRKNLGIKGGGGGCYIATSVYGSYEHKNVLILREFRDEVLTQNILGRLFISMYYYLSPKFVKVFGTNKIFKIFWIKFFEVFIKNYRGKNV